MQIHANKKQQLFLDFTLGTLLYTVVLGFFSDYTHLLDIRSYSVIFASALVLQVLTYATLQLKKSIVTLFRRYSGGWVRPTMVLAVWFLMFSSKFVFLEVLDIIFGSNFDINGFVALLVIIIVMLVAQKSLDAIYKSLQ